MRFWIFNLIVSLLTVAPSYAETPYLSPKFKELVPLLDPKYDCPGIPQADPLRTRPEDFTLALETLSDVCSNPTVDEIIQVEKVRLNANYPSEPPIEKVVQGVKVKGHPKIVAALEESLKTGVEIKQRFSNIPSRWKPSLKPECQGEPVCLLTALVQDQAIALKILNFKAATGFTISLTQPSPDEGSGTSESFWKLTEIQTIERAIRMIPKEPMQNLQKSFFGFFRKPDDWRWSAKSNIPGRAQSTVQWSSDDSGKITQVYSGGVITDDSAFEEDAPSFAGLYAILHEMAHQVDFGGQLDLKTETFPKSDKYISNWRAQKGLSPDAVSQYSMATREEDFAETLAYYWTLPQLAVSRSPTKTAFFEKNPALAGTSKTGKQITSTFFASAEALTLECLKNIYSFETDDSGHSTIWEESPTRATQLRGRQRDEFYFYTRCMRKHAIAIADDIKAQDPLFCKKGGIQALEIALLNKAAPVLDSLLKSLEQCGTPECAQSAPPLLREEVRRMLSNR